MEDEPSGDTRRTRVSFSAALSTPSVTPTPNTSSRKKTLKDARDNLRGGDAFYYADEFNLSWMPTLKSMFPDQDVGPLPVLRM